MISSDNAQGWFSEDLMSELGQILKNQYKTNPSALELQQIGLNIARFVFMKEMDNV